MENKEARTIEGFRPSHVFERFMMGTGFAF